MSDEAFSLASSTLLTAVFYLVPVLGPAFAPHHGSSAAQANLARKAFRLEELGWLLGLISLFCKVPYWQKNKATSSALVHVAMTQLQSPRQQENPPTEYPHFLLTSTSVKRAAD